MQQTAAETLSAARRARSSGDVDACLLLSAAAQGMAEDAHDPDTAFLAAGTPGRMYAMRGEPDEAAVYFRRALHVALSGGLTLRLPEVYHDLFVASRDARRWAAAKRYCAAATELYLDTNPRNPRMTALVADCQEGRFMRKPRPETAADALHAWRSVPASLPGATERVFAGCSMLVSAAWLGLPSRYRRGAEVLDEAYPKLDSHEGISLALSYGATGALALRDEGRAEWMARTALETALRRGERVAEERARAVLDEVLSGRGDARRLM